MKSDVAKVMIESLTEEIRKIGREIEDAKQVAARIPALQAQCEHIRATQERFLAQLTPQERSRLSPQIEQAADALKQIISSNDKAPSEYGRRGGKPMPGSVGSAIIKVLTESEKPLHIREIHSKLGIERASIGSLSGILAQYVKKGWLIRTREGFYAAPGHDAESATLPRRQRIT